MSCTREFQLFPLTRLAPLTMLLLIYLLFIDQTISYTVLQM